MRRPFAIRAPTLSYLERTLLWISTRVTQQAQPSTGLPVRVRKAHHLWAVANYMVAAHDEVDHRDVRILDEFRKRWKGQWYRVVRKLGNAVGLRQVHGIRHSRKPAESAVRRDEDVDARIRVHWSWSRRNGRDLCAGSVVLAEFTQAVQKNRSVENHRAWPSLFPQHPLHVLDVSVCAGPPSAGVRQPSDTSKRGRPVCDD